MVAAERGDDDALRADIAFHVAILRATKNRFYAQFTPVIEAALYNSIRFTNRLQRRTANLTQSRDPLLRRLIDAGAIRADAHRLGLDVDAQARVIDAAGHAQPGLFAVGPMLASALVV